MTAYTVIPDTSIDADSLADAALMTALRDNALAIGEADAAVPDAAKFGKLIAFTKITATNATFTPDAKTRKMVVLVVSGGGNGAAGTTGSAGHGGVAGSQGYGVSTSVSGTYAATIGAAQVNSSFIGTGLSVTSSAPGAQTMISTASGVGGKGASLYGLGGVGGTDGGAGGGGAGGAGSANSGAGGGGGGHGAGGGGAAGAGGSGVIFLWEYS